MIEIVILKKVASHFYFRKHIIDRVDLNIESLQNNAPAPGVIK